MRAKIASYGKFLGEIRSQNFKDIQPQTKDFLL
jgi:hypothetical protein